jgi:hypothetical protein
MTDRKFPTDLRPAASGDVRQAQLERLVGDVLKAQPMRRAPASLETRVLSQIRQRQVLPWWRMSFTQWPAAARIALVLALAAVAKLTLDVMVWMLSTPTPVNRTVENSVTWAKTTVGTVEAIVGAARSLLDVIPSHWITLALAFSAGMYFMLLALGAAAYRTLYLNK